VPVIIERLDISGLLSHAKTSLSLDRGSYALVGENGAGKSSVVDALRLALMTSDNIRGGLGNLVSNSIPGGAQASVTLRLRDTESGDAYVVRVRVSRSGRREAELYRESNGSRRRLASGVTAVSAQLARILGLPPVQGRQRLELLEYTAILPQGRLSSIMDDLLSRRSRLRERLEKILGIEDYRRARSFLEGNVEIGGYALRKRLPERLARERAALEERLRERLKLQERLQAEIRETEERLAKARARLEELRGAREEYQKLQGRLGALQASLREAEERARSLRGEVARLEDEARRLARLREEYERLRALAGAGDLIAEYLKLSGELESTRREIDRLERALTILDGLPELEQASRRYADLQEEERRLQERLRSVDSMLAKAEERLERISAEEAELRLAVEAVLDLLPELAGEAGADPGEVAARLRERIEKLRSLQRELSAKAEALAAEIREKLQRAREARERAEKLRSAGGGTCPLCGSPLPRERALSLAEQLEAEASRLEEESRAAAAMSHQHRREAERLASLIGLLERSLARLEHAISRAPSGGEAERLRAEVSALQGERAELEARLARVRGELSRLRGAARRYDAALGSLRSLGVEPGPQARASVEERLASLRSRASELEERLAKLQDEILRATGAGSVREAVEAVRMASRRLRRVEQAVAAAGRVEGMLEEKRRELGGVEERIGQLQAEVREVEERLRGLEPLVREYDSLQAEVGELERGLERRRGELERLRVEVEELRARVEELGQLARKASRAVRVLEVLERAPPLVLESKLNLLSRYMSDALSSFNLDIVAATLTADSEGVTLTLTRSDGRTASVGELSGGEKAAVALSFVIALARLHAIRAGFLVLDEPTAELDRERRRTLVEILRRLSEAAGIDQLVVVTHDEDVSEAADVVCRVSKDRGVSRVDCGEPEPP